MGTGMHRWLVFCSSCPRDRAQHGMGMAENADSSLAGGWGSDEDVKMVSKEAQGTVGGPASNAAQ